MKELARARVLPLLESNAVIIEGGLVETWTSFREKTSAIGSQHRDVLRQEVNELPKLPFALPNLVFRRLGYGDVHDRSNKLDTAQFIAGRMSHNMDMFYGTIRHQQSIFVIKILRVPRSPLDCLVHERDIVRMNPFKNKLNSWFRCWVVLEDSIGFLRPEDLATE